MFVVDTNVLLNAVNSGAAQHQVARDQLRTWLSGGTRVVFTWGILYEFLRVATHRAVFPHPLRFDEALSYVEALLTNPRVEVLAETPAHAGLLRGACDDLPALAGSRFHDLHTAIVMREHGLSEIRTWDADFHRFPWIRPVSPDA